MNESKYYAGIGSRETPKNILDLMTKISGELEKRNWILRSGHAPGADTAFEKGCQKSEIFIPWKGFNDSHNGIYEWTEEQLELAEREVMSVLGKKHWRYLTQGAKKLHTRNWRQIFGVDGKNPSKFVICWTLNANPIGGTRTGILLAQKANIPVFNIGDSKIENTLRKNFNMF